MSCTAACEQTTTGYGTSLPHGRAPLRVAVVGAGALGSEFCRRLAKSLHLPASVLLIDADKLEPHNVPLSRLFKSIAADLGPACFQHSKAELIASRLSGTAGEGSAVRWSALQAEVADVGWAALSQLDLLVSCADSTLARLEMAFAARSLGVPMLDGGVFGAPHHGGRVAWFPPDAAAACYGCGLREDRRAELLAFASAPSLGCRLPADAAPMGPQGEVPAAIDRTAELMVESLTDGLRLDAASSAERLRSEAWAERLTVDRADAWMHERIALPRSETCPWHEESRGTLVPLVDDQPLRACLPAESVGSADWRLQLTWPVCMWARCRVCGQENNTPQRLATLRRKAVCAGCGAVAQLEPLRCIASLGAQDAELGCTPRQLGLPAQHLLVFRRALLPGARSR